MFHRARSGLLLQAAFAVSLLCAFPSRGETAPEIAGEASDSGAGDTASIFKDIRPVLAHAYPGVDTAALLARIQEREKWGEKDERLIEAEGILRWYRGEATLALPCLKRLTAPGPRTMGLLAEGLLANGERYEAAAWFLKSARALKPTEAPAAEMYKRYLEIKPGDVHAELQLAAVLEQQARYREAADLYWKHADLAAKDAQTALRVGALLASQGRNADAIALYRKAREAHPEEKALAQRTAETRESMGQEMETARAWADVWTLDASDSTARNRAIAHLEAIGPAADSTLERILEKALAADEASGPLNFKLAALLLRSQDRKPAYAHLERALKASPGNPAYLALLPEAVEGDSLIRANFPALKARYEKEGASLRLALLVARGYSLAGDRAKACAAWGQVYALSPKHLDGRRDAFLDFESCGDPASLMMASIIGTKQLAAGFDREASRSMVRISLKLQDYSRASGLAAQLVTESPEDAAEAFAAAKAMNDASRFPEAKAVLIAIGKRAPIPGASMILGRMHHSAKEYALAAEQFRIARDSFPEAMRLRGECLLEAKDYEGAAAEFEAHYAQSGDKESLRHVADLYKRLGFAPKEAEVLETLAAKGWAGDEDKLRLADLEAAKGDLKAAMDLYDGLLRNRTALPAGAGWSEAAILFGMQSAKEGGLDKAIRALSMGLKTPPDSMGAQARGEAWSRLGECLMEKRQWKEALSAYASALASDSMSGEAAAEMLAAAKKLDAKKEIGEAARAVYRLDSTNEEANAILAASHQAAHEYKQAAAHYRRVAGHHPSDAKAWENLGNALAMIPDLKAASGPLQTAIDLGAQSDEVYVNRARAYRMEGSKDMAASILEFLLNRNAHNYLAVLWSAKFAEEDGNPVAAKELFKKSAKLSAPRSSWPELAGQGSMDAKVSVKED